MVTVKRQQGVRRNIAIKFAAEKPA